MPALLNKHGGLLVSSSVHVSVAISCFMYSAQTVSAIANCLTTGFRCSLLLQKMDWLAQKFSLLATVGAKKRGKKKRKEKGPTPPTVYNLISTSRWSLFLPYLLKRPGSSTLYLENAIGSSKFDGYNSVFTTQDSTLIIMLPSVPLHPHRTLLVNMGYNAQS